MGGSALVFSKRDAFLATGKLHTNQFPVETGGFWEAEFRTRYKIRGEGRGQ